ncbi:MAG TPA: cytidylate kinase-like family protein [Gemmatimonadales bacterium]|jgi:cytidylate kinase
MLITISRQFGAGGSEVARRVAAALGWRVVDNELVEQVAARAGLTPEDVAEMEERVPTFVERLARTLAAATPEMVAHSPSGAVPPLEESDLVRITEAVVAEIADQGKVVLVGRAAPAVLARRSDALHVRVVAPKPCRIAVAARRLAVPPAKAEEILDATDKMRARYSQQYYHRDWHDSANYHMVLNTEALGLDGAVDAIVARARALGW